MAELHPYLTFNGNCGEAMRFYQSCLGGTLQEQKLADSPLAPQLPPALREKVLHSSLRLPGFQLHGSDMVPETGMAYGNAVSLALLCESETELKRLYEKLSAGGAGTHPPMLNTFGGWVALLTDRYGFHWMLRTSQHHS